MIIGDNLDTAYFMEDDNGRVELRRNTVEKDLGVTFTNDLKPCNYPMQEYCKLSQINTRNNLQELQEDSQVVHKTTD